MKTSNLLVGALLAMSANVLAGGAPAQGDASASSDTAVSANHSGASATNSNASMTSANTQHAQAGSASSSEMNATLSKPIDARKAKPGDPVTATNDRDAKSADGTSIKRGSTLMGHVTKAQLLEKSASGSANAQSMLSVVFDKAVLKDGSEVPLHLTIQAVAAAESQVSDFGGAGGSAAGYGAGSARGAGGGLLGGVGGSVAGGLGATGGLAGGVGHDVNRAPGGVASVTTHSVGSVGGLNSSGMLASGSKGVFGISGLDFGSSSGGSESSAITSSTRNVRLDGGTRLLLANGADGSAMASGAAQAAGSSSSADAGKDSPNKSPPPSEKMRETRGNK